MRVRAFPNEVRSTRRRAAHGLRGRAAWMGAVLVVVSGCTKPLPPGKVRLNGVVEVEGKKLTSGIVHFFAKAGADSGASSITPDGRFSVVLSPGDYGVAVIAKDGIDRMEDNGKPVFAKSLIAEKYSSTTTSELTVSVSQGCGPVTIAVER
jgi:hypothetical protein